MSRQVDLSKLPAPQIIEELDFETLLAARKTNFINRFPIDEQTYWTNRLTLEQRLSKEG